MSAMSRMSSGTGTSMFGRIKASVKATVTTFFNELIPPHYTQPYKFVLIGQTGSGKTSFLNLLCNCEAVQSLADGFQKDDLKRLKEFNDPALENPEVRGMMKSKTHGAKCYKLDLGNFEVDVIDTPGFGDTAGKTVDKENTKKIIDVLNEEEYVNCICFIINGTDARMTESLEYVLKETTSILPKKVLENVVVVFSRVNDRAKLNFKPECLAPVFGREVKHMFFIDNPYSIYQDSKGQELSRKATRDMENAFGDAPEELERMFRLIKEFPPMHTHQFVTLYEKKQKIEDLGADLLAKYDNQVKVEGELEDALKKVSFAAKRASLSEKEFSATKFILEDAKEPNTICGAEGCNKNCHEGCWLPMFLDKTKLFRLCEAFTWGGECKVCGHEAELHYSSKGRWVETKQGLVDADVKNKFENAKDEKERAEVLKRGFEAQKRSVQSEKKRLCQEILKHIEEFQTVGVVSTYAMLLKEQLVLIRNRVHRNKKSQDSDLLEVVHKLEQRLKHVAQYL